MSPAYRAQLQSLRLRAKTLELVAVDRTVHGRSPEGAWSAFRKALKWGSMVHPGYQPSKGVRK